MKGGARSVKEGDSAPPKKVEVPPPPLAYGQPQYVYQPYPLYQPLVTPTGKGKGGSRYGGRRGRGRLDGGGAGCYGC